MEFEEAAVEVLREESRPLHWTVILDLALRRGYLDPFTQPDPRSHLLRALGRAAREGTVEKQGSGVYALPPPDTSG
jgi:hypothetical protein